jgi:hypothetical protein
MSLPEVDWLEKSIVNVIGGIKYCPTQPHRKQPML